MLKISVIYHRLICTLTTLNVDIPKENKNILHIVGESLKESYHKTNQKLVNYFNANYDCCTFIR